jgi:hypothetical protein
MALSLRTGARFLFYERRRAAYVLINKIRAADNIVRGP